MPIHVCFSLWMVQMQAARAASDVSGARAAVLRLRAERDRLLMDAIALGRAAAEAAVRATRVHCFVVPHYVSLHTPHPYKYE